jgi:hypothetical protein
MIDSENGSTQLILNSMSNQTDRIVQAINNQTGISILISNQTNAIVQAIQNQTQTMVTTMDNNTQTTNNIAMNNTQAMLTAINGSSQAIVVVLNNNTQQITQTLNNQTGTQVDMFNRLYAILSDLIEVQTKDVDHYNIQVSNDANFTTIAYNRFTTGSDFRIDELALQDGTYYTRVRIYSSSTQHYGGWSTTLTFVVNNSITT